MTGEAWAIGNGGRRVHGGVRGRCRAGSAVSIRTTHPADRAVAVFGALQGSGVLLTDRLVLTCAHVVRSGPVWIAHPAVRSACRPPSPGSMTGWTWPCWRPPAGAAGPPGRGSACWTPARRSPAARSPASPGSSGTARTSGWRWTSTRRRSCPWRAGSVTCWSAIWTARPPPARTTSPRPCPGSPAARSSPGTSSWASPARSRGSGRPPGRVRPTRPHPRGAALRAGLPQDRSPAAGGTRLRQLPERPAVRGGVRPGARRRVPPYEDLRAGRAEPARLRMGPGHGLPQPGGPGTGTRAAPDPPLPQRIDTLLTDRPRVLLRGEAGAGKTTLLWWLAAHASARTLDDDLAPLNGLVPFVVPLRTLRARGVGFPGPAELSRAAGLPVDTAPEGWAGRVLGSGRALLLVDGLDEVPPEDREQAHDWLSQPPGPLPGDPVRGDRTTAGRGTGLAAVGRLRGVAPTADAGRGHPGLRRPPGTGPPA